MGALLGQAGPLALAAFAGTLLGGIALSFFWKNFGPWQMLESCREQCARSQIELEECRRREARTQAELSDLRARYDIMLEALARAGIGIGIYRS